MPLTVGGGVRTRRRYQDPAALRRRQGVDQQRRRQPPRIRQGSRGKIRRPVHRGGDRRQARQARRGCADALGDLHPWRAQFRPVSTRIEYAQEVVSLGAGEILLTSMDRDGTRQGFDIPLTQRGRRQRSAFR